jgi:3-oxoacyl-[acyl-carrier-protein] synthase II
MIPAEGAGIIFLETLESARKRGATIYAEVLGYGLSCDANHITEPSVEGISKAIVKALKNSGVSINAVDYISAHGTGTKENDKAECEAICAVFGKKTKKVPVSSVKSMLGHTMGAAAALEAIVCCLAINEGKIPPTINHESDDPDCGIDCVPNKSRSKRMQIVLNAC